LNNPTAKDIDDTPTPNKIYNHLYSNFQQPATKTFTIRFLAYSGGTCVNIISKTVTVSASPKVQFVTMPGICLDATARQIIQATETGGVAGASPAFQYYGNGVNTAGLFTPNLAGVGTYPIKAVYTSNKGCQDSVTRNITVWYRQLQNLELVVQFAKKMHSHLPILLLQTLAILLHGIIILEMPPI
jgi:hypothetical protein